MPVPLRIFGCYKMYFQDIINVDPAQIPSIVEIIDMGFDGCGLDPSQFCGLHQTQR